jgi:hypothetical protein
LVQATFDGVTCLTVVFSNSSAYSRVQRINRWAILVTGDFTIKLAVSERLCCCSTILGSCRRAWSNS